MKNKNNIEYLYEHKEIAQVLSSGFAKVCQEKPKFPINYLARFLKNHNTKLSKKVQMLDKIKRNQQIIAQLRQKQNQLKIQQDEIAQTKKVDKMEYISFVNRIQQANRHQDHFDYFCQWINQRFKLSGVYMGELMYQVKKIDTDIEDSQEAHIQLEKQKVIKFKYASDSQKRVIVGKELGLESVVGKLLTQGMSQEAVAEGGEQQAEDQGQNALKANQVKGQIYFSSVVGNKELKFFKFPKLGAYYAIGISVKSYLKEKLFDQNAIKVQNYSKVLLEFEREMQQKQIRFRQAYNQKANSGAEEKQLEEMQAQYQNGKAEVVKPVLEDFQFLERKFVLCMDTLGQDREISENDKVQLRQLVGILKKSYEKSQKSQLQSDIDKQQRLLNPPGDQGAQSLDKQNPNYPEQYNTLIQEEERQLPGNQQVDRVKDNEKLFELEMNTARLEKAKQYLADQKYLHLWDHLLGLNVVKYEMIFKQLLILLGYKKEEFCHKGNNVLDWGKTKLILTQDKNKIFQAIAGTNVRGSKPAYVQPYALCTRIQSNLQSLDPAIVAAYNIYLAFILRFMQLYCKTRIQDRQARVQSIYNERQARQQCIKQSQEKAIEKAEKLQAAKEQAEQKEQAQPFDQQAWNLQYDEENPPIVIPDEIPEDIDRDLEDIQNAPHIVEKAED